VTVIVGASSGIGRATAHALARRGHDLVLAARSRDSLEETAEECRRRGNRVVVVPTDVRSDEQVQALVDRARAEFGRIDVWVAAASVFSYGSVEDTPPEVFDAVLDTNLGGPIRSVRAVLPVFRAQRRGTLILIGSLYSRVASAYLAPYVSSKFALRGFAAVLRQELAGLPRVHVSLVMPATVDTPIFEHAANVTGRNLHPLPPVIAPARVARAIVRTARRPRPEVSVGLAQRVAVPFAVLTPRGYARGMRWVMDVVGLRGRRQGDTTGTVFAPEPTRNRVRGGWRSTPLRALVAAATLAAIAVAASRRPASRDRA
jgi:short-subunit dehydrogenase